MKQGTKRYWYNQKGRLFPFGFLYKRHMPRWLTHIPGLGSRTPAASDGTGFTSVFGATSRWLKTMVIWAEALGRRQIQPTDRKVSPSLHRIHPLSTLQIGEEKRSDIKATSPGTLRGRQVQPELKPLRLTLPRPGVNAPFLLFWELMTHPFMGGKSRAQESTLTDNALRPRWLDLSGLRKNAPLAFHEVMKRRHSEGSRLVMQVPKSSDFQPRASGGSQVSSRLPRGHHIHISTPSMERSDEPREMMRSRMKVPGKRSNRRFDQREFGSKEHVSGHVTGPVPLLRSGSLKTRTNLAKSRSSWTPMAFKHWVWTAGIEPQTAVPTQFRSIDWMQTAQPLVSEASVKPNQPTQPRRFRSTLAREMALLVKEISRIVEGRIRQITGLPTQSAKSKPLTFPKIDSAEVFRLAHREYRERAFRVGR